MGARNAARSTGSPRRMANAAAVAPREWATTAWAGPLAATTAARASASSRMVLRPGPSGPGPEAPWLGASKATTRWPASTSGATNPSSCQRHPPQPWTRYTSGPAPQTSPATVSPWTRLPVPAPARGGDSEPEVLGPAGAGGGRDPLQQPERPNDRAFLNGGELPGGHRRSPQE